VIHAIQTQGWNSQFGIEVHARIARESYGIMLQVPWVEGKHDPRDKSWDQFENKWVANNQMSWFLKQVSKIPSK